MNGSITCCLSYMSTAHYKGFYSAKVSRQGVCKRNSFYKPFPIMFNSILKLYQVNFNFKHDATTLHTLRFTMACSHRPVENEESVNSRLRSLPLKRHESILRVLVIERLAFVECVSMDHQVVTPFMLLKLAKRWYHNYVKIDPFDNIRGKNKAVLTRTLF